ncbi:TetR/AcrR family transcriptional regulator [Rugamonas sp. CCM 8940]|uniref:TetR/AcrR family transcriptional regulator n=1 Tax=Rugamonas sp. CCM 8940 TaxID=2765359 RepID=UPI0018F69D3A|nr:TetR/AcrR family transcriptional regulator [Rugamonas sp. CCM 8940]MBJ7314048.1 TetR/AcrR family transcriptional regulator [Rugamonas sp. CCM 8940]
MHPTEKRRSDPERAQHRRKQVLDAATLCFSRSGFHGASMAEISKAAGMSAGHIYNYFDNKDAIIMAFVEQDVERIMAELLELEKNDDPLQAMLDDAAKSVKENLDPALWRLWMEVCAEAARNPKIAAAVVDADLRARLRFRTLFQLARERKGLAHDDFTVDGRIEAIVALFQGLSLRALHNPGLDEAALVASFVVAMRALCLT